MLLYFIYVEGVVVDVFLVFFDDGFELRDESEGVVFSSKGNGDVIIENIIGDEELNGVFQLDSH